MVSCIAQATLKLTILLSDSSRLRLQAYPTVPSYIPSLKYFVLELHFWDLTSVLFVCIPNRWLLPGYVEVIPVIDKFFTTVCICVCVCVSHAQAYTLTGTSTHRHAHPCALCVWVQVFTCHCAYIGASCCLLLWSSAASVSGSSGIPNAWALHPVYMCVLGIRTQFLVLARGKPFFPLSHIPHPWFLFSV